MRQFKNLYEAFTYQTFCPICSEKMIQEYVKFYDNGELAEVDDHETIFKCNIHTNDLIKYSEKREYSDIHSFYGFSKVSSFNKYTNIFRINSTCRKCFMYGYLTQVHISMGNKKISNIFLNSESISIEESDQLYEIRNVYAADRTDVFLFDSSNKENRPLDRIEFPLIPLDIIQPKNTLERVKKLIAFL